MKEYIVKWSHVNTTKFPEELIRCKECIWLGEEHYDDVYRCELHNTDTIESNYCSWAERKEECSR